MPLEVLSLQETKEVDPRIHQTPSQIFTHPPLQTNNNHLQMELHRFMNVISHLAFRACHIIKAVHERDSLQTRMKGELNPVTLADITIQDTIVKVLTSLWPDIQIVGEEQINVQHLETQFFEDFEEGRSLFGGEEFQMANMDLKDFCVWVDPLDGTLSFTRGDLEDVTVMIGISYKKRARIGVIATPYTKDPMTQKCVFSPKVLLGDCDNHQVFEIIEDLSSTKILPSSIFACSHPSRKIIISKNLPHKQIQLVRNICNDYIETCAMGNKFVHLVRHHGCALIYLGKVASLWDTCAGEALIKCLGGRVSDLFGQDIVYDNRVVNFHLDNGIVCSFEQSLHERINSALLLH